MIVCVAANPSIDKLFEVKRLIDGAIHRPVGFVQVAGGKGLNAARGPTAWAPRCKSRRSCEATPGSGWRKLKCALIAIVP
jgi:hypothetical protein